MEPQSDPPGDSGPHAPPEIKIGRKILKPKRRMRDTSGERHFVCGCRQSYLTYSSLYTHVKNKHKSVFPTGSLARVKIKVISQDDYFKDGRPSIQRFFEEFIEGLHSISGAYFRHNSNLTFSSASLFPYKIGERIPEYDRLKVEYEYFLDIHSKQLSSFIDSLNIYRVLAFYFCSVENYCSLAFLREYVLVGALVCRALNCRGYALQALIKKQFGEIFGSPEDVYDQFEPEPQDPQNPSQNNNFCDSMAIPVVPEIMNQFVSEMYPVYLETLNATLTKPEFIGTSVISIQNVVFMTRMVANWLYHSGITDYRLEINNDL